MKGMQRRAGVGATAGLVLLAIVGCAASPARSQRLADANAAYRQGQHQQAYDQAVGLARTGSSAQRDEAAYLAGMSAKQLGRRAEAIRYLSRAARSSDRGLAADALSGLGLTYSEDGRYADAANALLRAADRYTGQDRAEALFYAAVAQQKLGRWAEARDNLVTARAASDNPAFIRQADQQLAVTGYTLQIGAFTDPANARRAAQAAAARALALRLGAPQLVAASDRYRRRLTLVQLGRFATFDSAQRARQAYGDPQAIVVPLARR